ncbi:NADH dehydrogenase FAD-containing subunit, partial [Lacticaseibacillus paracasei]
SWFIDKLRLPFTWLQPAATSGASAAGADATSAATGAAAGAAKATKTVFSLSYQYGNDPMMVFEKMPNWYYSITKALIPNQQVAFFMQKAMTIMEILIGLALVAGLFTWLTSAATIAFVGVFCLSGMFYWVNIWMIPMGFACM